MSFPLKFGDIREASTQQDAQSVTLHVSGMKCAGCVQSVERQLLRQNGVANATVNLVTEKATVEFLPALIHPDDLAEALTDSGFDSKVLMDQRAASNHRSQGEMTNLGALVVAIALVLFSALGHLQEIVPIEIPVIGTMAFHGTLATLALIGPGRSMIVEGTKALLRNQPTMDTLVSMGSVIAYFVSLMALIFPVLGWDCFFDATVMIIGLILLGRTLEGQAKLKAKSSFQALLSLQSPVAHLLVDADTSETREVTIESVIPGNQLQVFIGDHFPVDGIIIAGETLVDESMLTGESLPVPKQKGELVTGGTLNQKAQVIIQAQRTGSETTLAKITRLVEEAQTRKASIQRIADTVAGYFTYGVMAIALLTFLFWWGWGTKLWPEILPAVNMSAMHGMASLDLNGRASVLVSLKLAIAVLVIACPCALGLATPTAILVGTSLGAERGLLLRGGDVLEQCSKLKTIVFDKTGTLTAGQLSVTHCFLAQTPHPEAVSETQLLRWIASVEQSSRHPLSLAILNHVGAMDLVPIQDVQSVTGAGIVASHSNHRIQVGTRDWLEQLQIRLSPQEQHVATELMHQGKTVVYCAIDGQFAGGIALQDSLRADAQQTLGDLRAMGLRVHVLTGDRRENTAVLLQSLDLSPTQIDANLSPSQKANRIKQLQQYGPVAMVGDGINDAPALAQADVGIALSSGTDVAMETAQVVLTRSQVNGNEIVLSDIVQALRLSHATFAKIKQNLFWAFIYNLVGIPMAAGLLFPVVHIILSPSAAAALMACSSVSVVGNSLLLQMQWRSA